MTDPINHPCFNPETEELEHEWSYHSDWEGDPGVINGTHTFYFKRCTVCDEEEGCDRSDIPEDDGDY